MTRDELQALKAKALRDRQYNAAVQQARKDKLNAIASRQLAGLPDFIPELEFHPVRKWRLDYAWPQRKVALEVHGGVFKKSRHTTGVGFTKDREKMNEAQLHGWIVIEVTTDQLTSGEARGMVERALKLRGL